MPSKTVFFVLTAPVYFSMRHVLDRPLLFPLIVFPAAGLAPPSIFYQPENQAMISQAPSAAHTLLLQPYIASSYPRLTKS